MGAATMQHSFSGHETFPFRYPWLKKGFDAVAAAGDALLRDDAITTLGVGKNMVRSIRHWCLAAGVLEENRSAAGALRPTDLGNLLFADDGLDPYLEDPATLWLLHWQIASNRARATTWFWTFSHFHEPEFSREALTSALYKWTQTLSGKPVAVSLGQAQRRLLPADLRPLPAEPREHRRGFAGLSARRAGPYHPAGRRPALPIPARDPARPARRHSRLRCAALLGSILAIVRNAGRAGHRSPAGQPRPFVQDRRIVPGRTAGRRRTAYGWGTFVRRDGRPTPAISPAPGRRQ